jgi:hypothetical protein
MFNQSRIRRWPDPPQQNQMKIIVVGGDLEMISRLNLASAPDCLRYYQPAVPVDLHLHERVIITLTFGLLQKNCIAPSFHGQHNYYRHEEAI